VSRATALLAVKHVVSSDAFKVREIPENNNEGVTPNPMRKRTIQMHPYVWFHDGNLMIETKATRF